MPGLPGVDLEGRVALVAGGARGLGAAIAEWLGSAGAEVMVFDADRDALERIEVRSAFATFECDFASPVGIVEAFAALKERFGRLDVLVWAQRRRPPARPLLEISFDEYRRTLATDLDAGFLCVQQAARLMREGGEGGRIVLVGAASAPGVGRAGADHEVAQAALRGLVTSAAAELAAERITVNGILPGAIRTDLSEEELEAAAASPLNPSGMVGEPDDVARAALWLIDPDNAFVTGTLVAVDGGAGGAGMSALPPVN
jgi:NAD(P)-dependent dehydrogenase (short-subunit alcohol dehydrogenase family)